MTYKVTFLENADTDLQSLVESLNGSAPLMAAATLFELESIIKQLQVFPFSYQSTENPTIRRAFLNTAKHTIYFRVDPSEAAVLAVVPQLIGAASLEKQGLVN